jgi:hypothetical protein
MDSGTAINWIRVVLPVYGEAGTGSATAPSPWR